MKSWLVQSGSGIRAEASGIIAGNLLSNMASNRVQIRPIRKPKRFRSAFTTEQVNYLEQKFKKFPYISSEHRKEIAASLNMQERAIKIWFQNRRMKEKKETNNKELNDDINQAEEFGKYQLNNLCTLQSTNEQLSYSLPTITKPERVDSTYFRKINTFRVHYDDDNLKNTNLLSMNVNQNHNKKSAINVPIAPIKQQEKVPMKSKIQPSCKPPECKMEITIGLCKKEKEVKDSVVRHNIEQEVSKKLEVGRLTCSSKARKAPVDFSSHKVQHIPQGPQKFGKPQQIPSNPSKQPEISGPTYFPVVPTIYAHPFISSGGMIWKPVSVVPVMSTQPAFTGPSNSHEHFGHDQKSICSCNCHENVHPVAVQPGPINPYAQYVITTPLENTSPNI